MNFEYIKTDAQLYSCCASLQDSDFLAVDTEFIRVTSFYPALGLLQISSGKAHYLIDPLTITNWQPLMDLFAQKELFFHACGEDVELFQSFFPNLPESLFGKQLLDTQIFAFFLGATQNISYVSLVEQYCGIILDKTEKRTDWLARPLTENQCRYAMNDVVYLAKLIDKMKTDLKAKNWLNAAYEECHDFVHYRSTPKQAELSYLSIKKADQLHETQVPYLKALATWRFETAQQENKALNFVIKEEALFNLAKYRPRSFTDYVKCGVYGKQIKHYGEAISQILHQDLAPTARIKLIDKSKEYKMILTELKQKAQQISLETGLDPHFLVQKRHVIDYVLWQQGDLSIRPVFVFGWRAPYFELNV